MGTTEAGSAGTQHLAPDKEPSKDVASLLTICPPLEGGCSQRPTLSPTPTEQPGVHHGVWMQQMVWRLPSSPFLSSGSDGHCVQESSPPTVTRTESTVQSIHLSLHGRYHPV